MIIVAKKYIKKITTKDAEMLRAFSSTGYLTERMMKESLLVAHGRIKNFARDDYIEKVSYLDRDTKNAEFAYRLTERGRKLCLKQLGVSYHYRSSSPKHDLALADRYLKLNESEMASWITESEWRERFYNYLETLETYDFEKYLEVTSLWENGQISPPDGGYLTEEGVEIAIEIVTTAYGTTEIEAKERFVQLLQIEYQQIKI